MQLEVYPGELFNINVTITDELNKSLGGIVRLEGQFSTTNVTDQNHCQQY